MGQEFTYSRFFPFCSYHVENESEFADLIELISSQESPFYTGTTYGSLFPIGMSLRQAMNLFWRAKLMDFYALLEEIPSAPKDLSEYYGPWVLRYNNINTDDNPETAFDAFYKKTCSFPQRFIGTNMTILDDPFTPEEEPAEFQAGIFDFFRTIDFTINGTVKFVNCVSVGDSGNSPQNWTYYPSLGINLARYNDFWTTYWPLNIRPNKDYNNVVGQYVINFNFGDYSFPLVLHRVAGFKSDGTPNWGNSGSYEFSNIDIELWPELNP